MVEHYVGRADYELQEHHSADDLRQREENSRHLQKVRIPSRKTAVGQALKVRLVCIMLSLYKATQSELLS